VRSHSYIYLSTLIILYFVAVLVGYRVWPGKYDAISAWVVLVTGSVILWYTWETMQLRKASYKQIEIQLRPFVILELIDRQFQLRNLGPGIVLNIKVNDVILDIQKNLLIRFPDNIPLLPPSGVKQVTATSSHGNTEAGDFFLAHLDPSDANLDLTVNVNFYNVEMKEYRVTVRVQPGNLEILGVRET
jgi:hypothetical protein